MNDVTRLGLRAVRSSGLALLAALVFAACRAQSTPTTSAPTAPAMDDAAVAPVPTLIPVVDAATPPPPPVEPPVTDAATASSATNDSGVSAAFTACNTDSDCVAVPRNGCCHNGWKEAVASTEADAYKASFTCARHNPCPHYMVRDVRKPVCDGATKQCVLVAP